MPGTGLGPSPRRCDPPSPVSWPCWSSQRIGEKAGKTLPTVWTVDPHPVAVLRQQLVPVLLENPAKAGRRNACQGPPRRHEPEFLGFTGFAGMPTTAGGRIPLNTAFSLGPKGALGVMAVNCQQLSHELCAPAHVELHHRVGAELSACLGGRWLLAGSEGGPKGRQQVVGGQDLLFLVKDL